jgi:alcohol dehydrogenase
MLPMIAIPTTAGTGSEAQSYAVISDAESHAKMACGDPKAAFRVALLDPALTLSQPNTITATAGFDAIAHAVETYVTTRRNPVSEIFSQEAWKLLEPNFERVLAEPNDLRARSAMQLGAYFAGVAIEGSMLGATHACANPLTANYGTTTELHWRCCCRPSCVGINRRLRGVTLNWRDWQVCIRVTTTKMPPTYLPIASNNSQRPADFKVL